MKLAYLIDATAAPVCIIAPISSWAAAVSSYVPDGQGLSIFIKAIPFNFYALFKVEYGPSSSMSATPSRRATCSPAPTPMPV